MNYLPIILSVASLLFAIYSLASKNSKENTTELTTVIVKLESIGAGITDIKAEINGMKTDQKEDHDRLIKVESSVSSLWKQFNDYKASEAK